jgi:hypothetical protein
MVKVDTTGISEGRIGLEAKWEWESLKAVGGSIAEIILHRGREKPSPEFVGSGLEHAQSG